ncbi:hypothetical protein D3C73_1322740 [compost metagenome]
MFKAQIAVFNANVVSAGNLLLTSFKSAKASLNSLLKKASLPLSCFLIRILWSDALISPELSLYLSSDLALATASTAVS